MCNIIVRSFTNDMAFNDVLKHVLVCKSRKLKHTLQMHKRFFHTTCTHTHTHTHTHIHCPSNNVITVRHLRRQCQSQESCSGRTPCARTNVDENVETLPERHAPCCSGLAEASEWCRMAPNVDDKFAG